ncbi:potassium transporter TrkG [Corynebacterium qintianiae]|uniref:potassium transporter TrkG n=1 Tax=Corynebacterium qintianiae TaxID=2709392 RepID=UPI0013EA55C6
MSRAGVCFSLVKLPPFVERLGPARLTAVGFLVLIFLGTVLLMMPFSTAGPQWTPFLPALFTATSAVSLTGLVVEDTGTYWTPVGQAIILALIQLGGLGIIPLAAALIGGGLGFPVWAELLRLLRKRAHVHRISITARMTLVSTVFLLVAGMVFTALAEWNGVLREMGVGQKLLNAFFMGASPRTAGFNAIDYADAHPITLMGTDILMFIGGGSAGTAGGVKVTTACVLLAAMASEFLGRERTSIGHRTLPYSLTRQALALAFAGVAVVTAGVAALRVFDPEFTGDQVSFEVMSAFATVGLSTGITANLSAPSQIILCLIMYLGRVGPTTLVAALAARSITRRFEYPEERPFIG